MNVNAWRASMLSRAISPRRRRAGFGVPPADRVAAPHRFAFGDDAAPARKTAGWSAWGEDELELGYAISPEHQGCGYAVEVASALLSEARRHRLPRQLVGFALVNNAASRHVLERIGMTFEGERVIGDLLHALYRAAD